MKYGKITYEAYSKARDWKDCPQFESLSKELQDAWDTAGQAVSDNIALATGRG
jgi:hypothetical protein